MIDFVREHLEITGSPKDLPIKVGRITISGLTYAVGDEDSIFLIYKKEKNGDFKIQYCEHEFLKGDIVKKSTAHKRIKRD
jgi:hypothetical protein